jgi:AcrR family transcriptional regulator
MLRPMTQVTGRVRAAALPLEERRSAIVAATLPLFLEQGVAVTTREIAQAAGIAEGTIFRVFEDKTALLDAVIEAALDPAPTEAAIRAIDPTLSFEDRLIAAVGVLRRVLYVQRRSVASGTTRARRGNAAPRLPRSPRSSSRRPSSSRAHLLTPRACCRLTFACVHWPGTDRPLTSEVVTVISTASAARAEGAVLIKLIATICGATSVVGLVDLPDDQSVATLTAHTRADIIDPER